MCGIGGQVNCTRREGETARLTVQIGQGRALVRSRCRVLGAGWAVDGATDRRGHRRTGGVAQVAVDGGARCRVCIGVGKNPKAGGHSQVWGSLPPMLPSARQQRWPGSPQEGHSSGAISSYSDLNLDMPSGLSCSAQSHAADRAGLSHLEAKYQPAQTRLGACAGPLDIDMKPGVCATAADTVVDEFCAKIGVEFVQHARGLDGCASPDGNARFAPVAFRDAEAHPGLQASWD